MSTVERERIWSFLVASPRQTKLLLQLLSERRNQDESTTEATASAQRIEKLAREFQNDQTVLTAEDITEIERNFEELEGRLRDLTRGLEYRWLQDLRAIVESGFVAETREWIVYYVWEVLNAGHDLAASGSFGHPDPQAVSRFEEVLADSLPKFAVWLTNPGPLVGRYSSISLTASISAIRALENATASVSGAAEIAGFEEVLSPLRDEQVHEEKAAKTWLLATTLLIVGAILLGLWAAVGIEIGELNLEAPKEATDAAAPALALGVAAAWAGRHYGSRRAREQRLRDTLARAKARRNAQTAKRLKTLDADTAALVLDLLNEPLTNPPSHRGPGLGGELRPKSNGDI